MHGSDLDLRFLVADLNMATVNLFDTMYAYKFLQRLASKKHIEVGIF